MDHFRKTLFSRNFFTLWSSQIISELGDRLNQMALVALVYSSSPGSVMAMAKLVFFIVIPVFIVGPLAGACVDRWSRKKIMIISDIARGLMVLSIPLLVSRGMMGAVYVLIFLIFSATRFFLPSKMAMIPCVVAEENLLAANTLSSMTRIIASALGFVVSGFLVKWLGYVWGFYLDSATYFISAVLIFTIITKRKSAENLLEKDFPATGIIKDAVKKNIWKEILEGIEYMTKPGKMRDAAMSLFVVMSGAGFIFCVFIVFVQDVMRGSTGELGVLGACCGLGLLSGAVLYGKYCGHVSKVRSMFAGFALAGIFLSLFVLNEKVQGYIFLRWITLFLLGFSSGPIVSCANYLVHVSVPDEARGRVFSGIESVIHLGFILFMIISAAAAKFLSTFTLLFSSGIVFAVLGSIGTWRSSRENE